MKSFTLSLADFQDQASAIVEKLTAAGLSQHDISVLLSDNGRSGAFAPENQAKLLKGITIGAGTGGTVGGVIGHMARLGSLGIPRLGPFIAAGPVIAALGGGAIGASIGAIAGALVGLGTAEYKARQYENSIKAGGNTKLNYWKRSWPLVPSLCPCDLDFVEYIKSRKISKRTIFHFGSGAHHVLGKANMDAETPNEILSITASPEEHRQYVDFIIKYPTASRNYKVLFADIYTLNEKLLPAFDLVTLFHLHEFYDEKTQAYAQLNDRCLLDMFVRKLSNRGLVLFYKGSNGFGKATSTLQEYVDRRCLIFQEEYRSLVIYRRGPSQDVRSDEQ